MNILDNGIDVYLSPFGCDQRHRSALPSGHSRLCETIFRNHAQNLTECSPAEAQGVDPLQESSKLRVVEQQLVHESVDAHRLAGCFLLKSRQGLLIDPERLGDCFPLSRHTGYFIINSIICPNIT